MSSREDKIAENLERSVDQFLKNQSMGSESYPEDTYRRTDNSRYDRNDWDADEDEDIYDIYEDDDDDDDDDEFYRRRSTPQRKRQVQKVRQKTVKTRTKVKRRRKRGFSMPSMPSAAGRAGRGVMGLAVLIMRVISGILFLAIAAVLIRNFWSGAKSLGSISSILAERNWALALFLILSAGLVGFGVISAAWTLSTRKAGDGRKLRSYDTGRGLLAFLIFGVLAMFSMIGVTMIPSKPEILLGALQWTLGIMTSSDMILKCSVAGAVLCIVRRLIGS